MGGFFYAVFDYDAAGGWGGKGAVEAVGTSAPCAGGKDGCGIDAGSGVVGLTLQNLSHAVGGAVAVDKALKWYPLYSNACIS